MFSRRVRHGQYFLLRYMFLIFGTLFSTQSYAQIQLTFGVYAAESPTTMVIAYRPILSELETVLSRKLQQSVSIRFQIASTYQKGINALASGDVDFAMLGPASYIEALELQPGLNILALESKDGSKTFNGVICVREDSSIENISDIKGKRFAFGNKRSTIGRYLSQALLIRNGITANDLASFHYLERHDHVAHSVSIGKHDAGALKEGTYKKQIKLGLKLRKIATIPLINRPWVASAKLEKPLFNTLKESLLNLHAPKAFKSMGRTQFVEGSDTDFDQIRAAINSSAVFFSTP